MQLPDAKLWLQRGIFTFAGVAVAVNLGFALMSSLPDNIFLGTALQDDASPDDVLKGSAPVGPQDKLGQAALQSALSFEQLSDVEPAAGDDNGADGVEIATGTPEYSGDGNVPPQPRGLGLPEIKIANIKTFEQLNDVIELLRQRRQYLIMQEDRIALRGRVLDRREEVLAEGLAKLEQLRTEIDALIEQKSEVEERELQRLVKVYEGMKAKNAAVIFNTLEMDVLIDVVRRMREAKFAVIMQSMSPARAELITETLAAQAALPDEVKPKNN